MRKSDVKRAARFWSLVAELEALRAEFMAMVVSNSDYHESAYLELAGSMREVRKQLEEV